jgi:hypothetical protein
MKKRYLVHPGMVVSKNDGQEHYISAHRLMKLYQVDPRECLIQEPNDPFLPRGYDIYYPWIHLYPRYDGDYPIFRRTK